MALANRGTKMIGAAIGSLAQVAKEKMAGVAKSAKEQGKKVFMSTATGRILEKAYNTVQHRPKLKGRIRAMANNK